MKKKRIVKLEPQTVELFAEVLSKLRPPPPLTVSQWADKYRVLSAESSAEPGRWHTEKAPYQRAIMDVAESVQVDKGDDGMGCGASFLGTERR